MTFITMIKNKLNLHPKFLEVFICYCCFPCPNWCLPAKPEKEKSTQLIWKSIFQTVNQKLIIKGVGRNQFVRPLCKSQEDVSSWFTKRESKCLQAWN